MVKIMTVTTIYRAHRTLPHRAFSHYHAY